MSVFDLHVVVVFSEGMVLENIACNELLEWILLRRDLYMPDERPRVHIFHFAFACLGLLFPPLTDPG
jgi:hypothetical protein